MKRVIVLFSAICFYSIVNGQRVSDYQKPWFEYNKVDYRSVKSDNPLLANYDVKFYKIDLNVTNTSKTISGNVTINAQVVGNPMSTLVLDLINVFTIDSLKVNGVLRTSTHANDEISVTLPSAIAVGNNFSVIVYYHGTTTGSGIGYSSSRQVTWTLSESYHAKDWFPCKQVLSDKADSAYIFLTCANTLKAGSNGKLTNVVTVPGSKLRYEWKERYPINYYLLSFAVGNYQEYNIYAHPVGIADSILIQNYVYNGNLSTYKPEIDNTPSFIVLLSDLYGMYPFKNEKYGHSMAPIGGGMEHQTMTTLSSFSFELIIHELGHMWFGDNVTCSNWQDIWVNEGFATYTHYLGLQYLQTQADADQMMLDTHNDIMVSTGGSVYLPIADVFNESRIFDYRLSYEKGAAIIHTMRFIVNNDTVFFNVLRNFQQTYGSSVATGDDFRNMIASMSGINFTDYFDQWYYGEGYPTYNVIWNQNGNTVNFKLNQQGSMPGITPFFKLPIEIQFNWAGGDTIVRFDQTYNDQIFSVNIPHTIQTLAVDPNNWIVNKVGTIVVGTIATDIQDLTFVKEIKISPNPATDFINIISDQELIEKSTVLTISDITGNIVQQFKLNSDNEKIDVSGLSNGMYLIKSNNTNIIKPVKFLKISK